MRQPKQDAARPIAGALKRLDEILACAGAMHGLSNDVARQSGDKGIDAHHDVGDRLDPVHDGVALSERTVQQQVEALREHVDALTRRERIGVPTVRLAQGTARETVLARDDLRNPSRLAEEGAE